MSGYEWERLAVERAARRLRKWDARLVYRLLRGEVERALARNADEGEDLGVELLPAEPYVPRHVAPPPPPVQRRPPDLTVRELLRGMDIWPSGPGGHWLSLGDRGADS